MIFNSWEKHSLRMVDSEAIESAVNGIFESCEAEDEIASALCKVKIKIPADKVRFCILNGWVFHAMIVMDECFMQW